MPDERELKTVPADRRVAYGSDRSQFYDVFDPRSEKRGLLLMIHGGFWRARWDLEHASAMCAALAATGYTVANLEYRRIGNGGGWPATYDDVRAGVGHAVQALSEQPMVLGHSAGGHLALRLASDMPSLRGVVALAPAADLDLCYQLRLGDNAVVAFLGGTPEERPEAYANADPARHAATVRRLILHGDQDHTVPIGVSRAFAEKRRGDPGRVEVMELSPYGHFDLIDPASAIWSSIVTLINDFGRQGPR